MKKMKSKTLMAGLLVFAMLNLFNCKTTVASYRFLTTSENFDLEKAGSYKLDRTGKIKGHDKRHFILFIIPVYWNKSFKNTPDEAVDMALSSMPGAVALQGVKVYASSYSHASVSQYIPSLLHFVTLGLTYLVSLLPFVLYEQTGYVVEGSAVIDETLLSKSVGEPTEHLFGILKPNKEAALAYVSGQEYKTIKEALPSIEKKQFDNEKVKKATKIIDRVSGM